MQLGNLSRTNFNFVRWKFNEAFSKSRYIKEVKCKSRLHLVIIHSPNPLFVSDSRKNTSQFQSFVDSVHDIGKVILILSLLFQQFSNGFSKRRRPILIPPTSLHNVHLARSIPFIVRREEKSTGKREGVKHKAYTRKSVRDCEVRQRENGDNWKENPFMRIYFMLVFRKFELYVVTFVH